MATIAQPSRPGVKPEIDDIYVATLTVVRDGKEELSLRTPLPENFEFSLASSFSHPFDQPLSDIAGPQGQVAQTVKNAGTYATGMTTQNKYLSGAMWSGGSRLSVRLPFVIHAHADAKQEVLTVMKQLLQFVAPSEGIGGMLSAPGPTATNPDAVMGGAGGVMEVGGDIITVNIGKFFTMSPCVITDVSETFDTQFNHDGIPIAAMINVSVESFFTTTKQDLDKFFAPGLG